MKLSRKIFTASLLMATAASILAPKAHAGWNQHENILKNPPRSAINKYIIPEKIRIPQTDCETASNAFLTLIRFFPTKSAVIDYCTEINPIIDVHNDDASDVINAANEMKEAVKRDASIHYCYEATMDRIERQEVAICTSCRKWPDQLPAFEGTFNGEAPDCERMLSVSPATPEATPEGSSGELP